MAFAVVNPVRDRAALLRQVRFKLAIRQSKLSLTGLRILESAGMTEQSDGVTDARIQAGKVSAGTEVLKGIWRGQHGSTEVF
jgi:hypothetical protein